ncbi:hypothetical protein BU15DRAFT_62246 [Melanogaster broomeanus]|nr:hypothetical protein BU15DRAFT_62246 [Melanogaster broomeanus]
MSGLHEDLSFANNVAPWKMKELLDTVDEAITLRWVASKEGCNADAIQGQWKLREQRSCKRRLWNSACIEVLAGVQAVSDGLFHVQHKYHNLCCGSMELVQPICDPEQSS